MQVKLIDDKIVSYSEIGAIEDGVTIDDDMKPDYFDNNFKPGYYLLKDGRIIVNPDYQELKIQAPQSSGPSHEMLAINALGVQVAKLMSEKGGV